MGRVGYFHGFCSCCGKEIMAQTKIALSSIASMYEVPNCIDIFGTGNLDLRLKELCPNCRNLLVACIRQSRFIGFKCVVSEESCDFIEGYFGEVKRKGEIKRCSVCNGTGIMEIGKKKFKDSCCYCNGKGTW